MSRDRLLRSGHVTSRLVNKLGWQARSFFYTLISTVADDGTIEFDSILIRSACFPILVETVTLLDMAAWIEELIAAGLASIISKDGKQFLILHKLNKQPPKPEIKSAPDGPTIDPLKVQYPLFPVIARDGQPNTWLLDTEFKDELRIAFPAVNIDAEALNALMWLKANLSRRKTHKGMRAFLTSWMRRTQDRSGAGDFKTAADRRRDEFRKGIGL
jgi:hypothetical protein